MCPAKQIHSFAEDKAPNNILQTALRYKHINFVHVCTPKGKKHEQWNRRWGWFYNVISCISNTLTLCSRTTTGPAKFFCNCSAHEVIALPVIIFVPKWKIWLVQSFPQLAKLSLLILHWHWSIEQDAGVQNTSHPLAGLGFKAVVTETAWEKILKNPILVL